MDERLKRILTKVQKPARYTGGEYNEIIKKRGDVDTRIAFCFRIPMRSNVESGTEDTLRCIKRDERGVVRARFRSLGRYGRGAAKSGHSLFALESGDYIRDFDIIAFSLGYEMAYTNVVNMLSLAGVPLFSKERQKLTPLVIAGGTACYNAEPLADFVDIFLIGEGEDVICEVTELYRSAKRDKLSKEAFLKQAVSIQGVYVPSLYDVSYNADGTVCAVTPLSGAPATVTKRIVQNFNASYYPEKTIVPSTEIVHDRVVLELFRGCIRGCRFCQPVMSTADEVPHAGSALKARHRSAKGFRL